MKVTEQEHLLLELCALRREKDLGIDWSLVAREASAAGDVSKLAAGQISEKSKAATGAREILRRAVDRSEARERVAAELDLAERAGARLVTVLSHDYPANLRLIGNLPPFLFVKGRLRSDDVKAVAVVGTRAATVDGVDRARRMARLLTAENVTVVSGLARGIDTAAHIETLSAAGRTIAVVGTGITRTYPAENAGLADDIVRSGGAVVSQFWPSSGPARWTFPRRNVVMSGVAQGTVVIEASKTSGAKMQARLALEHGKKVFLVRSLVLGQDWAQQYVAQRGAIEVETVDDVVRHLVEPDRVLALASARQLSLDLG